MSLEFFGILWADAQNIVFIPLLVIPLLLLLYKLYRSKRVVTLLSSPLFQKKFLVHFSFAKQIVKSVLLMLGLIFLFLGLLRPQWDKKEEKVMQEGRDIFIALDISRSMLVQDVHPNRLDWAKSKIKALLKMLKSDRVGLILFSGSTFVQCPLTADTGAFCMYLDQIDVDTISSGSTAIDQAIKQALQSFKATGQRKHKLLLLFTDGEDFSSNLHTIKEEAIKENMNIFAIGVGTSQGGPIPLYNAHGEPEGHQLDKNGKVIISRVNDGILKHLTQDSGGTFVKATTDSADIKEIVKKVHQFEKEKIEEKKVTRYEDQYPYFLGISFICFAIEWLL